MAQGVFAGRTHAGLSPDGGLLTHCLGAPLWHPGVVCQAVVLADCIVAPGFVFSTFQLASAADLDDAMSRHGAWVQCLLAAPALSDP